MWVCVLVSRLRRPSMAAVEGARRMVKAAAFENRGSVNWCWVRWDSW